MKLNLKFIFYFFLITILVSLLLFKIIDISLKRYTLHDKIIHVPSLVGLSLSSVEDSLKNYDLKFVIIDSAAYNPDYLRGSVLSHSPNMGAEVNREEVNNYFKIASKTYLKGILNFEEKPLVSNDFVNNPNSAIIDGTSTMVINKKMLKVYAWYDNEWAYSLRLIDLVEMIIEKYK